MIDRGEEWNDWSLVEILSTTSTCRRSVSPLRGPRSDVSHWTRHLSTTPSDFSSAIFGPPPAYAAIIHLAAIPSTSFLVTPFHSVFCSLWVLDSYGISLPVVPVVPVCHRSGCLHCSCPINANSSPGFLSLVFWFPLVLCVFPLRPYNELPDGSLVPSPLLDVFAEAIQPFFPYVR